VLQKPGAFGESGGSGQVTVVDGRDTGLTWQARRRVTWHPSPRNPASVLLTSLRHSPIAV